MVVDIVNTVRRRCAGAGVPARDGGDGGGGAGARAGALRAGRAGRQRVRAHGARLPALGRRLRARELPEGARPLHEGGHSRYQVTLLLLLTPAVCCTMLHTKCIGDR